MSQELLSKRFIDLRMLARYAELAFNNKSGGTWAKFLTGGVGAGNTAAVPVKLSDTDIFDFAAVNKLFDRTEAAKDYREALDKSLPAANAMRAKRQSDILSSMQQATRLRYMTRMRHMAAAQSRDESLADADIGTMEREVSQ